MRINPSWFAIPLTAILVALSALHAYWALGGRWGIAYTIPTTNKGTRAINPGPLATWIVCGLLALAAAIAASHAGWLPAIPLTNIGVWGLSAVFALRAIGEFRLIGFFKSVTGTDFAQYDTLLYSPLCLLLAALAAALAYTTLSTPNP